MYRFPLVKRMVGVCKNIVRGILEKAKQRCIDKDIVLSKVPTLKKRHDDGLRYIVSLTSYGHRVRTSVPYAIYSLLNQSVLPDKIVLWLDRDNWHEGNIPFRLRRLQRFGLEIRFCEDLKSYKKLLPALEAFPDDYILTADDDVYYPRDWFESLLAEHTKHPTKIICYRAHGIKVDENHHPLPYSQWDWCITPNAYFATIAISPEQSIPRHQRESVFPTGVGGILYPPKCFHEDIANKELFLALAPKADDIWFWAMAVIHQNYFGDASPYVVVENEFSKRELSPIRLRDQTCPSALCNFNCSEGGNDRQLQAVLERYPQLYDTLRKIDPFCYSILEPSGYVMELDTTDWIQKWIYAEGCYEKTDVLTLLAVMPEGGIFFDIGANVGVYALNLCTKAKQVYAFEATEKTYAHLLKTIARNGIKNIRHSLNAVHDVSGVDISIWQGAKVLDNENDGNNGMYSGALEGNVLVNNVKSVAIDDFVRDNQIEQIDLLKVDVEGNEFNVLKGATESLLRFRPMLFCEINPAMNKKAGYTSQEMLAYIIHTLGYRPMRIANHTFTFLDEKEIVKWQCNVFFCPKEKSDEIMTLHIP